VNTDPHPNPQSGTFPQWTNKAAKRLERYEQQQLQPGRNAYVIITNMCFHRALQNDQAGQAIMAHGLGNDFWLPGRQRISDVYRRKKKHIDIHNLICVRPAQNIRRYRRRLTGAWRPKRRVKDRRQRSDRPIFLIASERRTS
jgi:hypothetical protein